MGVAANFAAYVSAVSGLAQPTAALADTAVDGDSERRRIRRALSLAIGYIHRTTNSHITLTTSPSATDTIAQVLALSDALLAPS